MPPTKCSPVDDGAPFNNVSRAGPFDLPRGTMRQVPLASLEQPIPLIFNAKSIEIFGLVWSRAAVGAI